MYSLQAEVARIIERNSRLLLRVPLQNSLLLMRRYPKCTILFLGAIIFCEKEFTLLLKKANRVYKRVQLKEIKASQTPPGFATPG